jgi:hypothetical protein
MALHQVRPEFSSFQPNCCEHLPRSPTFWTPTNFYRAITHVLSIAHLNWLKPKKAFHLPVKTGELSRAKAQEYVIWIVEISSNG